MYSLENIKTTPWLKTASLIKHIHCQFNLQREEITVKLRTNLENFYSILSKICKLLASLRINMTKACCSQGNESLHFILHIEDGILARRSRLEMTACNIDKASNIICVDSEWGFPDQIRKPLRFSNELFMNYHSALMRSSFSDPWFRNSMLSSFVFLFWNFLGKGFYIQRNIFKWINVHVSFIHFLWRFFRRHNFLNTPSSV